MSIAANAFDLLAIQDIETEDVTVPEWGGATLRVRSITAAEREDLLRGSVTIVGDKRQYDPPAMRVKIVWLSVVDEENNRVFTTQDQLVKLGKKSAAAIDRIADVAMRLAGIGDDAGKAASSEPTSDSATG